MRDEQRTLCRPFRRSSPHLLTALFSIAAAFQVQADEVPIKVVSPQRVQNLLATEPVPDTAGRYVAFPAVTRLPDGDILVSYKRGQSHALDPGATLESLRLDSASFAVQSRQTLGSDPRLVFQMGEWVTFDGGRIATLVDMQEVVLEGSKGRNRRTGLQWSWSDDGGKTFSPMQVLGPIDGVQYGYVFDAVTVGQDTFVLAMTFSELTPGAPLVDAHGSRIRGTVHVVASSDGGRQWRHVRNLTQEFGGVAINESALLAAPGGFIVVTRGYDNACRIERVDRNFQRTSGRNLTAEVAAIESYVGRPRLFRRDGALYLLGRNFRGGRMELGLFQLDEQSLAVELLTVLDPDPDVQVKDGYYALPLFQDAAAGTLLNVITYRMTTKQKAPDLLRLEYDWNAVRSSATSLSK